MLKKLLPIVILIAFAAAWGYFSNEKQNIAKLDIETTKQVIEEKKAEQPAPAQLPPGVTLKQEALAPSSDKVNTDELAPLPANPYEQFMKAVEPSNNLNDSLSAINNKELRDDQVIRRNEYFEKLSQQLKDLQGSNEENNPPPLPPETDLVQEETEVPAAEPEIVPSEEAAGEPMLIPEVGEELYEEDSIIAE